MKKEKRFKTWLGKEIPRKKMEKEEICECGHPNHSDLRGGLCYEIVDGILCNCKKFKPKK